MSRSYRFTSPVIYGPGNIGFLTAAVVVSLSGWLLAQNPANDVPAPPTPSTDIAVPNVVPEVPGTGPGEVLTRGPIHEAFAKPVVENTSEPPIVPKTPPALIEELPPDEQPVGENILWIPGYYAWDEDRLDFIWISGVYRDAPPNHAWIAGYWRSVPGGSQWIPGFWTTVEQAGADQQFQTEVEFLPEPPATLEQGPSTAQPSDSHFWIPGNWRFVSNKYAWQAGYWTAAQAGWIWIPAHYHWTPQGYVYAQGYWDFSLAQRGLVFAPVYFDATYYANPVVYRPAVVLRPNFLTVHLWTRPQYAHYYFGDYYGNNYQTVGFRPWFTPLIANRAYYDPLFTYYSWQGRRVDPRWNNHIQQRYEYVVNHADARPPRSYREQYQLTQSQQIQKYVNNVQIVNSSSTLIDLNGGDTLVGNRGGQPNRAYGNQEDLVSLQIQNAALTANLAQVVSQQQQVPTAPLQLEKVAPATMTRFTNQGRQFREIAAQRQQMAGPRLPGVTAEVIAPSTSGKPTSQTVNSDNRSKLGGGKVRLPVVQPVVGVAATATPRPGISLKPGDNNALIPVVTPEEKAKIAAGRGAAAGKKPAATKAGQPANGTAPDGSGIATDRNPNRLGKNVPPADPAIGLGGGVVGGGVVGGGVGTDTGIAPLDIVTPGTGPIVNTQGNTVNPGQTGTTTPGNENSNVDNGNAINGTVGSSPSNNPNTTAPTIPGQRTPANGAFGQDQGPLTPPGKLAPGQKNPQTFNPRIADPNAPAGSKNAPAFNPRVADPNAPTKSNPTNPANTKNGKSSSGPSNTPNTTAPTIPGQRTPANGAFSQNQGPLTPPGVLAPGQQNPRTFNPKVADPNAPAGSKNAPAFNPRTANPSSPTKSGATNPGAAGTNNTKSGKGAATPSAAIRPRGPVTGPNTINGRPVGGNPGNDNPALRTGASAGPSINPNASGNGANPTGKVRNNPQGTPNTSPGKSIAKPKGNRPGLGNVPATTTPVGPGAGTEEIGAKEKEKDKGKGKGKVGGK